MEKRPGLKPRVAIVDDEPAIVRMVQALLLEAGAEAEGFPSGPAFLETASGAYDLVLCDLSMPEMSGLELLEAVRSRDPGARFVILTGHGSVPTAVDAMKKGATDFLAKPVRLEEIRTLVGQIARTEPETAAAPSRPFALGRDPAWLRLLERARKAADLPVTVLIRGETGTGKEVVARYIASFGPRAGKPFVVINCAAVPENLLESELFGHARGAFSGADVARRGLFEEAHGGTLFLDEAGSMGLAAQGKLLRVLEDRKVRRVGENRTIDVDVRILAATNVDLEDAVASGAFRADLYFRLAVLTLQVPALRERPDDIELLAEHFLASLCAAGKPVRLSSEARHLLRRYPFPGNIRELRNAIEQALVFSNGSVLEAGDFPALRVALGPPSPAKAATIAEKPLPIAREGLLDALERAGGNRVEAAKLLGVSRSTFYRLLTQFGLDAAPEPQRT